MSTLSEDIKAELEKKKAEDKTNCVKSHIEACLHSKEVLNEIREQILDDLVAVNDEEELFDKLIEAFDNQTITADDIKELYPERHFVDSGFCEEMLEYAKEKIV
jgi:DNA primase large subunit